MEDSFEKLSKAYIEIDNVIREKELELADLYSDRDVIRRKLVNILLPESVLEFTQPEEIDVSSGAVAGEGQYTEFDAVVYTDASYNDRHDIGSYAFLVKTGDGRTEKQSGMVSPLCGEQMNALSAEIFAVDQAINYVLTEFRPVRIFLYTDCQAVVNILNRKCGGGIREQWFFNRYFRYLDKAEIHIGWVKGHAHNTNNEICDAMARQMLKKLVSKKIMG